ncbi:hypothetical protein FI667_g5134, partial [Globisporangium splendens]
MDYDGANGPGITSFTTAQECIGFAHTPSKKILLALFTAPSLDPLVAKSLAQRLAYNYERSNNLENLIDVFLNQGPRLFRDAFSSSVEEEVDALLHAFLIQQQQRVAATSKTQTTTATHIQPGFILFYFSDQLVHRKHSELNNDDDDKGIPTVTNTAANSHASPIRNLLSIPNVLGFKSPLALNGASPSNPQRATMVDKGSSPPPRPGLTRTPSNTSSRSAYASTQPLFPVPSSNVNGDNCKRNKNKRKKKNAVMDHTEPPVFQRIVRCSTSSSSTPKVPGVASESTSSSGTETTTQYEWSKGNSTNNITSANTIVHVVLPFVKKVTPLFFLSNDDKPKRAVQPKQDGTNPTLQELKQITWTHFPFESSPLPSQVAPARHGMDLLTWKQGHCLLVYPSGETDHDAEESKRSNTEPGRLKKQREKKQAVRALFEVLESLVLAFLISRT